MAKNEEGIQELQPCSAIDGYTQSRLRLTLLQGRFTALIMFAINCHIFKNLDLTFSGLKDNDSVQFSGR